MRAAKEIDLSLSISQTKALERIPIICFDQSLFSVMYEVLLMLASIPLKFTVFQFYNKPKGRQLIVSRETG